MNYLEIILTFITTLARIIFPRRKRPVAGDHPCPAPLPCPDRPPLPPDEADGGDTGGTGSDALAPIRPVPASPAKHPEADWLGISGYCLMVAGGAGCVLKCLL